MQIFSAIIGFLGRVVGPLLFWKGGRDSALKDVAENHAEKQEKYAKIGTDIEHGRDAIADRLQRDL